MTVARGFGSPRTERTQVRAPAVWVQGARRDRCSSNPSGPDARVQRGRDALVKRGSMLPERSAPQPRQ
ncbi:MAG: hypothetical protein ACRDVP_01430, partial [Acidimicrobiales bacterium]